MKGSRSTVVLAMFLLALLTIAARCQPDRPVIPRAQAAENAPEANALDPSVEKLVRARGEAIATNAFGLLSSRLGKAISDTGMTNAITMCSVHGLALTKSVGVSNKVEVRRVTHRPRNPENRADAYELAIIRRYQGDLSKNIALQPLVTAHKAGYYTYYAPIRISAPLCLNCHGQPDKDIKTGVLEQLRKSYPTDQATGFNFGDLRGLWSIDFKRSDFPAPASDPP